MLFTPAAEGAGWAPLHHDHRVFAAELWQSQPDSLPFYRKFAGPSVGDWS